jgi:hypothetical protein
LVARTYSSQVPLPARAQTSGMVAAGLEVGAIVEIDCANLSRGGRTSRRKPQPASRCHRRGQGSVLHAEPVPSSLVDLGQVAYNTGVLVNYFAAAPRMTCRIRGGLLPAGGVLAIW